MPNERDRDSDTFQRAREGDREAFVELVSCCMEKVARIVLYIVGNRAISEEVAQEAFLRAYEKIHTLKHGVPFDNWITRIAKNLAIDKVRRRKRVRPLLKEVDWGDPNDHDIVQDVRRELMKLPEKFRLPLLLTYYEGMSVVEVSKMLRIPVGTVKSRIHHAKGKMRKALESEVTR